MGCQSFSVCEKTGLRNPWGTPLVQPGRSEFRNLDREKSGREGMEAEAAPRVEDGSSRQSPPPRLLPATHRHCMRRNLSACHPRTQTGPQGFAVREFPRVRVAPAPSWAFKTSACAKNLRVRVREDRTLVTRTGRTARNTDLGSRRPNPALFSQRRARCARSPGERLPSAPPSSQWGKLSSRNA